MAERSQFERASSSLPATEHRDDKQAAVEEYLEYLFERQRLTDLVLQGLLNPLQLETFKREVQQRRISYLSAKLDLTRSKPVGACEFNECVDALDDPKCIGRSPQVDLIVKALEISGSPEKLTRWLQTPLPSLAHHTPLSLLHTEDGRQQVEDVLGRIEHGIF